MPFSIIRQDITRMETDAIVNAANTALKRGGGVCGAIFQAAGAGALQAACDSLSPIQTGEAVITPGFDLKARYIIHTAGPVYHGGGSGEEALLRACYRNSLCLAFKNNCESIAFPLISSGIYGYPKKEALHVATAEILDFLKSHDMQVYLAVFSKDAFEISQQLLSDVKSYIAGHYADQPREFRRPPVKREIGAWKVDAPPLGSAAAPEIMPDMAFVPYGINDLSASLDEPFSTALLRLIDEKGLDDVSVYKRANIDRKLFNKIKNVEGYHPGKRTVIALAIALELSPGETDDFLQRAGYALSQSQLFDVIISFFVTNRSYDIYRINEVLFQYDQPLLGS